ncbi:MAG: LysR family transcriptional regulator [Selenomonadaceae bacterium]
MELKDMQAFYAVVEEGNISHAAIRLDIAQPALSRQMKRLESSLGVQLFERGSRRIRLTDAGRLLYSRVEHILSMVDGTVREITEIGSGLSGSLRIGAVTSSGAMILPYLMSAFHKLYPHVLFEVWDAEGTRVLEMLDNHMIDIAITRTQVEKSLYESILLTNEPLVMVMRKDDAMNAHIKIDDAPLPIATLKDKSIILPLRWKAAFNSQCQKAGFTPSIVCESDSIVQDVLAVRAGLGMALLPDSARGLITDDGALIVKKIQPELLTHTVVSWLKKHSLSASAAHFIELFKKMYVEKH